MSFATIGRVSGRQNRVDSEDALHFAPEETDHNTGDFGDAGDQHPVQEHLPQTYAGTATLLQPAIYRDPTAQIDLQQTGLISPNEVPSPEVSGLASPILRFFLPFLPGGARTLPKSRPVPPPPTQVPPKTPNLPKQSPNRPLPPPFIPGSPAPGTTPVPEEEVPPTPPIREPPRTRETDIDQEEDTFELPRFDWSQKDFGKSLETYLFREDRRGGAMTTLGNRILAETCRDVADKKFKRIAKLVEQIGGSYKNGDLEEYLKEQQENGRRPDLTWLLKYGKTEISAHVNTATQRADGTLTAREQAAYDDLVEAVGENLVHTMSKLRSLRDIRAYRKESEETCNKVFDGMEGELDRLIEKLKRKKPRESSKDRKSRDEADSK